MKRPRKQQNEPGLPAVNLLSPWSFEAIATRRLRQRFTIACVALALAIAAGWAVQHLRVTEARHALAAEQAETALLTARTTALAPVRAYVASVEQQKTTVQETMAREVYFSLVMEGLREATPPEAAVLTVDVQLNEPPAVVPETPPAADEAAAVTPAPEVESACPGPDPFNTRVVVGCITLAGAAQDREAVSDLVIRLGNNKLFVEPFISTTTTANGELVTFLGSVGLSEEAFSGRYAELDDLLDLEGAAR